MTSSDPHDHSPTTGRGSGPADSVAGQIRPPRFLDRFTAELGHVLGRRIDKSVADRHRRRLRKSGWERALDASSIAFAGGTAPARSGNSVEILIDGADALPVIAREMAAATSHVHVTGWFLSPELALSREEEPLVVRTLLAELAERIDVRVLLWKGAPIPAFRPSRADVREMEETLTRHTKIRTALDSCTGASHCHHEKTIVIDDRVAFVGGIDLTVDGGDPYDTPNHRARGGIGWHDAAARIEGPVGEGCRGSLSTSLAERSRRGAPAARRAGGCRRRRAPDRPNAPRRHVPRVAARRLLDSRVVRRSAAVSRAHRLSREPVPVVTGDRRHPRRQVARSAERGVPCGGPASGEGERRRRHLSRPGGGADRCR